jgi:hypothetical protein
MTRYSPLAVLIVSLGLVACGGDDDSSSSSAPSRAEFAKAANRVCSQTDKDLEQVGQSADTPEEYAAAIDKAIDRTQKAADDLVALDRPEGKDGETAKQFVEGFHSELNDQLVPVLEEIKTAIKKKDAEGVRAAAAKLEKLETTPSDKPARELGATACVG